MANLNRKERRAQRNESNTIGMLLRLFFGLSFIGLAVVLFGEFDLNYVFSIFTADIIVSLIYVILNKSRITTSLAVNTNVRVIIAFLIMLVTMFFYAFALWRVDQFSAPMQVTLFIGGAIVYLYCPITTGIVKVCIRPELLTMLPLVLTMRSASSITSGGTPSTTMRGVF